MWVVHETNQVASVTTGPRDFLASLPVCAYTCTRLFVHSRVVPTCHFHVERLNLSFQALHEVPMERPVTSERLECLCERAWLAMANVAGEQVCGTFAVFKSEMGEQLVLHVSRLPSIDILEPVKVKVAFGHSRKTPFAKLSQWIADRKPLEGLKVGEVKEVVMERDGRLLEGLVSNVFVVEENETIVTAPSGVLLGSTRELVIRACEALNVRVRLEHPQISESNKWTGAFLTSAIRILTPIKEMDMNGQRTELFDVAEDASLVNKIRDKVERMILEASQGPNENTDQHVAGQKDEQIFNNIVCSDSSS